MKKYLIIIGFLWITVFAVADPLGFTVGAELYFGDVLLGDEYNFAGKADPVTGRALGQGSIRPYILYNKTFDAFTASALLSDQVFFDNPQKNDFKFSVSGMYNLAFNNAISTFTFSIDNLFRLRSLDWSLEPALPVLGWSDLVVPGVKYRHTLGFGSIYGGITLPLNIADPKAGEYYEGKAPEPEEYKRQPYVFCVPELGMMTGFGFTVFINATLQFFPNPQKTPSTPYGKFDADRALEQISLGVGYMRPPFTINMLFDFPVSGKDINTKGIKDQGFAITPAFYYSLRADMQLMVSVAILQIGKNTGDAAADKTSANPSIAFIYNF
jgi:hypothetical protein